GKLEAGNAVIRDVNGVTLLTQTRRDKLSDASIVFDHEDSHGCDGALVARWASRHACGNDRRAPGRGPSFHTIAIGHNPIGGSAGDVDELRRIFTHVEKLRAAGVHFERVLQAPIPET